MALGLAFNAVKGIQHLSPALQAFADAAADIIDPQERLEQLIQNIYVRSLMGGDDDQSFAGIRVNAKKDMDGLSSSARFIRSMFDQMLIETAMDTLDDIRVRMGEIETEMDTLATQLFGPEAQMRDGESREDWIERMNKRFAEGLEDGTVTQAEYDQWMALQDEWQELDQKAKAIENRLRQEYQQQQAIIAELGEKRTELVAIQDEVQKIKAIQDPAQQDQAIAILVSSNPDMDFDLNGDGEITVSEVEQVVDAKIEVVNAGISAATENIEAIESASENIEKNAPEEEVAQAERFGVVFGAPEDAGPDTEYQQQEELVVNSPPSGGFTPPMSG